MNQMIVNDTIKAYIQLTIKSKVKIDEYVPNTHIEKLFKDVLKYVELEDKHKDIFDNIKHDPYDSIGNNNPNDYDVTPDGKYVPKKTYSVGIAHLLPNIL